MSWLEFVRCESWWIDLLFKQAALPVCNPSAKSGECKKRVAQSGKRNFSLVQYFMRIHCITAAVCSIVGVFRHLGVLLLNSKHWTHIILLLGR